MVNAVPPSATNSLVSALDTKLIDLLPAAVYICAAPDGVIVRFNRSAAELWGREPTLGDSSERYCGSHRLYQLDGTPLPHANTPVVDVLRNGKPVRDVEAIIERPDGSRITVVLNVEAIYDDDGKIIGAVSVANDITERKRAEEKSRRLLEALHGEWERLIEVFERSPAFMAVLRGPDHIIERANACYYQLVGNRDIVGKSIRDAMPEIEGQGYVELLDQVYQTNKPISGSNLRIAIRKESGELGEHWLEFVYEPLRTADGSVSGVLIHGIDLTERKRAEERLTLVTLDSERSRRLYETILSNVPDLVYVFDRDCRFTFANRALLKMWGKTWEEACGKNCLELGYPAWHAAKHEREIAKVIATKHPVRDEVPFIGTDGLRIYDYIFVPVFGANGEVEAVAGTTRDVTERKEMEQELQHRAEELAAADQKKDEFIALLAHELRNPLAPVRNGLQVLELAGDDAQTSGQVRAMMNRQLNHMVRLIDDLLDVSRMNRNKLHLQKDKVQLDEIIANALETARPAIEAAEHKLEVQLPSTPVLLEADLTRLAQVFSNLLSNSTKYTQAGGQIWLIAELEDKEVVVQVRDTGIGIPADDLEKVFDMFSQIPRSLEQSSGGLGIGLALVKALVEMHGGRVTVASEGTDKGSTFTVRLPFTEQRAIDHNANAIMAPQSINNTRRILVVDDNEDSSGSMAMIFQLLGHDVHVAHDGLVAVAKVQEVNPDIILMDVGMPHLNGHDATRRIRALPGGDAFTIIAVTGWGQEGDRSLSKAAGCDAHLVKPVNLQDIEKLLASLVPNSKTN